MDGTELVSAELKLLAAATGESVAPAGVADSMRPPFRALVAEDSPVFRTMLSNILERWGYTAISAGDGDEAWRILQSEDPPRLAILDWMMPGMDGLEICRRLREAHREPYTYIVLLTARTEAGDLVEGMDAGADDYLTKPFRTHELRVRLRAGRRILDLQEELLQAREALRIQATHDALTGLHNRAAILEILRSELARSHRENQPLSLLLADLDHFKDINDKNGHSAGDSVLRETARRMKSSLRAYDAVGRYGGEEFLIVLPGCQGTAACNQADRIRTAVECDAVEYEGQSLHVSCSIGVAYRSSATPQDADALIREADVALYVAKNLGRNQVAAFATQAV